ncbi:MAG: YraN family protein [Treponema sp.]|nr:YraN family protein [Spirochaetia bacterium]MDD7767408.1 YraN family protein [Treponema sp.]MDY3130625.1 YraN family protein [Treponema sp.]
MNTKVIGNEGENKAVEFLLHNGYELLHKNWRTRFGEIDIIVKKDNLIVFVEVKSLPKGNLDYLSKVLNKDKQERIIKTSKRFLLNNRQYSNSYIRYDVIVIDMPGMSEVYHIENAFMELL